MKQETTKFTEIFCSCSVIAVLSVLLLDADLLQPDFRNGLPVKSRDYASVLSGNCAFVSPGMGVLLCRGAVKRFNPPSQRGMELAPPASTYPLIRNTFTCRKAPAVPPTPALHPAVSPATFVRAGPQM